MNCPTTITHNELHTNHDNMKALKWNSKGFALVVQTPEADNLRI